MSWFQRGTQDSPRDLRKFCTGTSRAKGTNRAGGSCTSPADPVLLSCWQWPFPAFPKSRHAAGRVEGKERKTDLLSEGNSHRVAWKRPLEPSQGSHLCRAEAMETLEGSQAHRLVLLSPYERPGDGQSKPKDIPKLGN